MFNKILYVKWNNENEEDHKYFKIYINAIILDQPLLFMNI